ncbi:MAG: hypothetical protein ABI705_06945 [Aestuariivirga sp.]
MNRRTAMKCIISVPLILQSGPSFAGDSWVILGKRILRPNARSLSFVIKNEVASIAKLGIEPKGNSIWLYSFRVADEAGKSTIHPINLNIPPISQGCFPHLSIFTRGERPRQVELDLEYLPLTGKPTEILLWGTT